LNNITAEDVGMHVEKRTQQLLDLLEGQQKELAAVRELLLSVQELVLLNEQLCGARSNRRRWWPF